MAKGWSVGDMGLQQDKRIFITGANSGLGYAAAVELAHRGAIIVMACRDERRGRQALERMKREASGAHSAADRAELVLLDLASLASVHRVAQHEVRRRQPLHGLINNAGVFAPRSRQQTADGFELQFGTNVLGHFALTCGLMPALERARSASVEDGPRVVTLASIAHKQGRLDLDDLQALRNYRPMKSYAQSKLADLMFAMALERRLRARSMGTSSIAVHPGVARSNLFKIGSSKGLAHLAERLLAWSVGLAFNSDRGGAVPTLFAMTSPEARGGVYYGSQGFREMRGNDVGVATMSLAAADVAAQDRLWQACERLTGSTCC